MLKFYFYQVLGWMSPVNKQYQTQLMNTNNSSSQVEPDLKEVQVKMSTITLCNTYGKYKINLCSINKFFFSLCLQKYVDSIIKGAIEKVKEEKSSKPFKVSLYTWIKFLKLLTLSLRLRLYRAGNQIVATWISKYFIL